LPVILSDINFSYGSKVVLKDISLEIPSGSYLGIVGPNGSGKSTLGYIITGIISSQSGTVSTYGASSGLVLTNPENQIIGLVVEEDVAFGPENLGMDISEISDRVENALRTTDCIELRDLLTNALSGGQIAKTVFAGQLAMEPDIIVLDEGTVMLDPMARAILLDLIKKLNRDLSKTVIPISHRLDDLYAADEVILLVDGMIKARAPGVLDLINDFGGLHRDWMEPGAELLYRKFLHGIGIRDLDLEDATYNLAESIHRILQDQ